MEGDLSNQLFMSLHSRTEMVILSAKKEKYVELFPTHLVSIF